MADSTTTNTTETNKDPLVAAKEAPMEASAKKRKDAKDAISGNTEEVKKTFDDLKAKNKSIANNKDELGKLEDVKSSFDKINRAGNNAATFATNVSGDAIAQSITEAAKAVKAALDSIEVTYPDASAMHARVTSVDVIKGDDSKLTQKIVDATLKATEEVESWKNNSLNFAVDQSGFLTKDVVNSMTQIAELVTAIGTLGEDVDTTTSETQAALEADMTMAAQLQKTLDGLMLANMQNDLIIKTSDQFTNETPDNNMDSGNDAEGGKGKKTKKGK